MTYRPPVNRNRIQISILVRIGDEVIEVKGSQPFELAGDRRKWARQIREHISGHAEFLAQRFELRQPTRTEKSA